MARVDSLKAAAMTSEPDDTFLTNFLDNLRNVALAPDDPRCVNVFGRPDATDATDNPVELLARSIHLSNRRASVQLFSGFLGTGKSTQLLWLKDKLERLGCFVVHLDIEDYLNTSTPIDISDFLITLAGALGDHLQTRGIRVSDSFWSKIGQFLSELSISSATLDAKYLKVTLKRDPSFRTLVQRQMAGHLTQLVEQTTAYFNECVQAIHNQHGPDCKIVMLVDSIEHIRGTFSNAADVQKSIEHLFAVQHEKLHLPDIHVVYTIHPYLRIRLPSLSTNFDSNIYTLPMIKVHERDGKRYEPGIRLIREIVAARGDWARLLGTDYTQLDRIIELSGGYLRDLFGLLRDVLLRAIRLPASTAVLDKAIAQRRNEYLPIADDDAAWLAKIAQDHTPNLRSDAQLKRFSELIEQGRVFCYQNGEEWFDVHPLIRDHVLKHRGAS